MSTDPLIKPHAFVELKVDITRVGSTPTGVKTQARLPNGRLKEVDIVELDRASLVRWLCDRGGENARAEALALFLLGHNPTPEDPQPPLPHGALRALMAACLQIARPVELTIQFEGAADSRDFDAITLSRLRDELEKRWRQAREALRACGIKLPAAEGRPETVFVTKPPQKTQ